MESKTKIKLTIITFFAIFFPTAIFGQSSLKEFTRTQHGYIFYINGSGEYVTFVPVSADSIKNELSNFDSKNLGVGYQINTQHINTDSLKKFGRSYTLDNYWNDTSKITIVPITLTYRINGYGRTEEQIKARAHDEIYVISKKRVTLQIVGGVSIEILSSTPKIYYYDVWE
jgi:hypothetical protein